LRDNDGLVAYGIYSGAAALQTSVAILIAGFIIAATIRKKSDNSER
jgi:hypothetical protein